MNSSSLGNAPVRNGGREHDAIKNRLKQFDERVAQLVAQDFTEEAARKIAFAEMTPVKVGNK